MAHGCAGHGDAVLNAHTENIAENASVSRETARETLFDRMQDTLAKWSLHRGALLEAISHTHGTHTEDDVLAMILLGKLMLWANDGAAMVTEFVDYPRLRAVNVFICGGAIEPMWEVEARVIAHAKAHGCTRITGGGRRGWQRALPGYHMGGYFMEKDF